VPVVSIIVDRMRWRPFLPALLIAAAIGGDASAKTEVEVVPLETKAPWQVDYGENECRMARKFDVGNKAAVVQLNRDGPLSTFNLAISAPGTPSARDFRARNARLRFDGDADWVWSIVTRSKSTSGQEFMIFPRLNPSFWSGLEQRIAENRPVILRIGVGGFQMAFNLQKMKALKTEFDKCEDVLMNNAGFDGAALRSLRQRASPIPSSLPWLKSSDYPKEQAFQERQDALLVWLDIDATGSTTDCRVLDSLGDEAFHKVTCELLTKRAKFAPAISAEGTPVRSYRESLVFWTISRGD
jgi:hypothetical protein